MNALVVLDKARKLLAEVKTYDEAAKIRSQAEAVRAYSQQRKLSVECYNYAAEIKLRAERKMGSFLTLTQKNRGGERSHKKSTGRGVATSAPTLRELGVTKDESARYQRLARVPDECFDRVVKETNETRDKLTTERVLKEAKDRGMILVPSKRVSETRVGADGKVNVTVTLRITEEKEQQFLCALEDLGDRATPLILRVILQAARRKEVRYETQGFQAQA